MIENQRTLELLLQDTLQDVYDYYETTYYWGSTTARVARDMGLPYGITKALLRQLMEEGHVTLMTAFTEDMVIAGTCWFPTKSGEALVKSWRDA